MNIILIGMMGAGKSSVGKILAKKLHWKFVDSDIIIEKTKKMRIPEIFAENGEKKFREIERNVIQKLCGRDRTVIAVGGGAPCFEQNWKSFQKNGFVVYLLAGAKTLFQRLKKDPASTQRPILLLYSSPNPPARQQAGKGEKIYRRIQDLLKKRNQFYEKADCIVQTDFLTTKEVTDRIVKIFNEKNPD